MSKETGFISDVAEKIFDSILDEEDLNALYTLDIINQKYGYKVASIAKIEIELESNPLIKTSERLYEALVGVRENVDLSDRDYDKVTTLLAEARGEI